MNIMKCHYSYAPYAPPPSSHEKLIRITLRCMQYDHLEPGGPGKYAFFEVYEYDPAGLLRYAGRSWDKGARECWYDEQGLIIKENNSHGYCGRLSSSTHWSYSYKATDHGLMRKAVYERFSYPQDSQEEGPFCRDDSREYACESYTPAACDQAIPLAFWYLDRESAKESYDLDSYYLYTHFDWDPMTVEFDCFASVDIIDHGFKHSSRICFSPACSCALHQTCHTPDDAVFLATPRQSKVMIPRRILGYPVNERIRLCPECVDHLYISPGFTEVEICDWGSLQSIYLPESLKMLAGCDGLDITRQSIGDVLFVVHKDSDAHRICEQSGLDYVLAEKDEISFDEYFLWADSRQPGR